MTELVDELSLDTLVAAVSSQLLLSQQRRIDAGLPPVFQVDSLTLEVSFVVTSSKEGGGGISISVVKADGKLKYDEQSLQKVTLQLSAVTDQKQPDNVISPVRPKLEDDRP
jgi:hypothetical protein